MLFYPKLLNRIHANPTYFLGRKSPVLLEVFFNGYGNPKAADAVWLEFNDWLATRFSVHTTTRPPSSILVLLTDSDEAAFELYFSEIDSCMQQIGEIATRPKRAIERAVAPRIDSLLDAVEHTPCGYLYSKSVTALRVLLDACALAWSDVDRVDPSGINLELFEDWLCRRSHLPRRARWERLLLYDSGNNEEVALKLFFERLREYRNNLQ